jgi:ferric enterobactin receptor
MRTFLSIAAIFFSTLQTVAQMPGGMPAGGPGNAGHLFGKITDASDKAVNGASVILMQKKMDTASKKMKDILLKAMITKANGEFSFEELPVTGSLTLKVSGTGFKAYEASVSFMPKMEPGKMPQGMPAANGAMPSFDKDLGNIKLENDTKVLQDVTITTVTPTIKLNADKKVFNVEKNIMSAGGTGVDVMRNVPSVNVDIDGNVTMRNAAPQLLVDGRPTTLSLDQIPADVIESVEVITNPSAKYDASGGGGGILNVVLKKNKKKGYNGNVRIGVDKRGAINGGGDISLRQNKFNFSASANVNQNKGITNGTTDRENLLTVPLTSVYQDNYNKSKGAFIFGKAGVDYFLSNRTTLSLSGVRFHGEMNPYETIGITTDSLYNTGKVSNTSLRITNGHREFNRTGLVFGMKQLFKKEGEELTLDANYFTGKNENNYLYTTDYYFPNSSNIAGTAYEKAMGYGSDKNFVVQTDFVLPFLKTYKLETGLRAAISSRISNNYNYVLNTATNEYELSTAGSSNYKNTDNVYAAYATLSNTIKDFSYKIGLRAERSDYNGTLINTGNTFSNKYPVSLFPSVFLSQKLGNSQEIQFSTTRRVNRPNFFNLIPFTDYTDKLNITRGNPALKPEFTQAYEMSYLKTFSNKNTFLASVYYKHSTDLITRYLTEELNPLTGNNDIINTYINANSSRSVGAEATAVNYLTKWWDISSNVNVYNSKINTSNVAGSVQQDALWSWFGKFNSNFKLPANFSIQLTATYQSKTNLPINTNTGMPGPPMMQSQNASQGYIKSNWGTDIAFKKSFLKNNVASVSLNISDIFRTRINSQYSYSDYFTQEYTRLRDPQMFRLNFSYRFGKIDFSIFKRKSTQGEQNASEGL